MKSEPEIWFMRIIVRVLSNMIKMEKSMQILTIFLIKTIVFSLNFLCLMMPLIRLV